MNPDTLRKAVELVGEPFAIGANGHFWIHNFDLGPNLSDEHWWKDALAAQLVRQVDALPEPTPMIVASATAVSVVLPDDAFLMDGNDKGRTENTITAIVESGVLEDE